MKKQIDKKSYIAHLKKEIKIAKEDIKWHLVKKNYREIYAFQMTIKYLQIELFFLKRGDYDKAD